jgi:hypothetical protein
MAFPTSPTNGQQTTINGVIYTYSTALTAWTVTSSGGSLIASTAVSATGNITGGNILTGGLISATGVITGSSHVGSVVSVTGAVTGASVVGGVITGTSLSVSGTTTAASVVGGVITGTSTSVTGSQTAASTVGGVITGTSVSVTGNITGGNVLFGIGNVSGTGNIAGGYFIGNGSALTGITASAPTSVVNGTSNVVVAASGNISMAVTGANIITIASSGLVNNQANGVGNIGNATGYFNTVFAKATSAQYADLAENYTADANYPPGTVVSFGGTAEITISNQDADPRVAGVISTNPSYIMNAGLNGAGTVSVALTGRVPTSVTGQVRKGDLMVSAGNGIARSESAPAVGTVIGKALENFAGGSGTIEIVVGRT